MKHIKLTMGESVIVDDNEYEELSKYKWVLSKPKENHKYAVRYEGGKSIAMHRQILNCSGRLSLVDHKNGNGLDNRKNNLRICDHQKNAFNTEKTIKNKSGFKGIYLCQRLKSWCVQMRINKKVKHLGTFKSLEDAITLYKNKSLEIHGDFSVYKR